GAPGGYARDPDAVRRARPSPADPDQADRSRPRRRAAGATRSARRAGEGGATGALAPPRAEPQARRGGGARRDPAPGRGGPHRGSVRRRRAGTTITEEQP